MSENQNQSKEPVKIKLNLEYELEIKENQAGDEEIHVSFTSSLENDLAALAIANYHARELKNHAAQELKKATDYEDRKNAQNALNSIEKCITGNTMIYNMMQNSYLKYRKTVQVAAELAKLKKQAENADKSEIVDTDTTPSDLPSEQ